MFLFPTKLLELHIVILLFMFCKKLVFQSGIVLFSGAHVSLESLLKDNTLKAAIKDVVRGSGRSYPVGENEESAGTSSEKQQQVANGKEKLPLPTRFTAVSQEEKTLAVH